MNTVQIGTINDCKERSPPKKSESMGTHASHDDDHENIEDESSSENSSDEENDPWTRDDYVNSDMFDPDEAIAAAVNKRKFLLKRLLEDQGRFPEQ